MRLIGRIEPDAEHQRFEADGRTPKPWLVYALSACDLGCYGLSPARGSRLFRGLFTSSERLYCPAFRRGPPASYGIQGDNRLLIELGAELAVEDLDRVEPLCRCLDLQGEDWFPEKCPWCHGRGFLTLAVRVEVRP